MDNELTPAEKVILRVNPGTHLISDPVRTPGGLDIYFATASHGRIVMQVIDSNDNRARGPIILSMHSLEVDLPHALGKFLQDVHQDKQDPRLVAAANRQRQAAKDHTPITAAEIEGMSHDR